MKTSETQASSAGRNRSTDSVMSLSSTYFYPALLLSMAMCMPQSARAVDLIWDSNGTADQQPVDGTGVWVSPAKWWNGSLNQNWPTLTLADTATFQGTAGGLISGNANIGAGTIFIEGDQNYRFSGIISGTGNFEVNNSGTTTFSALNTYSGVTDLNNGSVVLGWWDTAPNPDVYYKGGLSGTVNVNGATLYGGTSTVGQEGLINGDLNVGNGGTLSPGLNADAVGVLAVTGNLTLSNSSMVNFHLGAANTVGGVRNDLITVGGNLTLDGVLNITQSTGGTFGPGSYRIFNYTGSLTNNGMNIGSAPGELSDLTFQTSVAGQINLIKSTGTPLSFWDGDAGPKNNSQINGGNGTWELAGTGNNWTDLNGAANNAFANSTFAIFQGTAGTVTVNNSLGDVEIAGMQFARTGYIINGDPLSLVDGTTATLRVGDGSAGSNVMTATINTILQGDAGIAKTDLGTAILTAANTYTGLTAVNAGRLTLANDLALGDVAGGTTVASGASVALQNNITVADALSLNGGALVNLSGVNTWSGAITLGAASTISSANVAGGAIHITGGIDANGKTLTVNSGGAIYFDSAITNGQHLQATGGLVYSGAETSFTTMRLNSNSRVYATADANGHAFGDNVNVTFEDWVVGILGLNNTNQTIGSLQNGRAAYGSGVQLGSGTLTIGASNTNGSANIYMTGTGGLTKVGTGVQTFVNTLAYTGDTNINEGALYFASGLVASGQINVNDGGTLASAAVLQGNVTVNDGGIYNVGSYGLTDGVRISTIEGNLTLNPDALLKYSYDPTNQLDRIDIGGDLVLDGTLDLVAQTGATFQPGVYRLMNYSGNLTDNGLELGILPGGATNVYVQSIIPGQINLVNSEGIVLNFWDGTAGTAVPGDGLIQGGDGTWQVGGPLSWTDGQGSANAGYTQDEFAIFYGTGGTVTVDHVGGAVTAEGMQFGVDGYTIEGASITLTAPTSGPSYLRVGDGTVDSKNYTARISSEITGTTAEIAKTDGGRLVLDGVNTFTGKMTVAEGVLNLQNDLALGTSGTLANGTVVSNGAALELEGGITVNDELLTLNGLGVVTDTIAGGALRNVSGDNTWNPNITMGSLTRINSDAGLLTINGDIISAANGRTLNFGGSGDILVNGDIKHLASHLYKDGSGVTTLAGTNTYTGDTYVADGTLRAGSTQAFGNPTVGGGVRMTSGTGAVLDLNDFDNSVKFLHSENVGASTVDLGSGTLSIWWGQAANYTGSIIGTGGLTKKGAERQTLSGINTYTGDTNVDAGKLIINGSIASALTDVKSGATLAGSGTINGDVLVRDGGILAPGPDSTTAGTLTINGNLTLSNTTNLAYALGEKDVVGGAYNDLINVNGDLTLDGELNVTLSANGDFGAGIYRLINYTGALTNNVLSINTAPVPTTELYIQTSAPNQINLVNTRFLNLNFWDGDGGKNNDLIEAGTGIWQNADPGANSNWTDANGSLNSRYTDNSFVIFSSNPGIVTIDDSLGAVNSTGAQFTVDGYTITGDPLTLIGPTATLRVGDGSAGGQAMTATIDSVLQGTTAVDKTDLGTLVLTAANTYTGLTTVSHGALNIQNSGALGTTGTGTVVNTGAALELENNISVGAEALTLNGSGISDGGALRNVSGDNSYAGAVTLASDSRINSDAGLLTLSGPVANGGNLLTLGGAGNTTLTGVISGAGGITKDGAGVAVLSGTNTFTGDVTVNAGTLQAGAAAGGKAFGTNTAVTLADVAGTTLDLNDFNQTIGSLAGGGATGGNVDLGSGTLTTGTNNTDTTFAGVISGTGGLTKTGTGIQTLTGDNNYTGTTNVNGGGLEINGSITSLTNVNTGGTLYGTGTITGDVVVANGGTLSPGSATGDPGILNIVGNLSLNTSSSLDYSFGQAGVEGGPLNDLINITGDLTLDGSILATETAGGTFGIGVYRIFNYTGTLDNQILTIDPASQDAADLLVQTSIDKQVNLINTKGLTLNFWDGGADANKDNGTVDGGDGLWQNSTGINEDNWADPTGLVNAPYDDDSFVIFQGTPGIVEVDTSLGAVSTSGMQFVESGYTITGDPLSLFGPTATLRVGDGTAAGASTIATIDAVLQGAAAVDKTDFGTLVLTAANTYTGLTTVSQGVLNIQNSGALGTTGSGTVVNTGAALELQNNISVGAEALTLNGSGISDGGALRNVSGDNSYAGAVTLASDSRINSDAGLLTLSGAVANGGNLLTLGGAGNTSLTGVVSGAGGITKDGAGVAVLSGTNTFTGDVTVNAGTLQAGAAAGGKAFGTNTAVTLADVAGATLDLNDFNQTIGSLAGGGATGGNVDLGTATLTTGTNNSDTSFAGVISGTGGLTKTGTGIQTLTGDNDYTGATNVNGGGLEINGSITSLTNVNTGGTLYGTGTITGNVVVANGGTLAPGSATGTPGTLNIVGNLSLNSTSLLDYSFGAAGVVGGPLNDLINITGDLTLGGSIKVTETTGGTFGPGVYRIMNYTGALNDQVLSIDPTSQDANDLSVQTSIDNQVNLVNTKGLTLNYWDGGNAADKVDGEVDGGTGFWQNNNGNDNWTDVTGAINSVYKPNSFVIFQANSGTVSVDNSLGDVLSTGMQFAVSDYIISGQALTLTGTDPAIIRVGDGTAASVDYVATINSVLQGTAGIEKTDLGTLFLTGVNTYTGGTQISQGTVVIVNDNNLGALTGSLALGDDTFNGTLRTDADVTSNRTITLNAGGGTIDTNTNDSSFTGVVSGAGQLTIDGGGIVALLGSNNYTGGTIVQGGSTVAVNADSGLGSVAGDLTLDNGTLQANAAFTATREVILAAGGGTVDTGAFDVVLNGAITGDGTLLKEGAGILSLTSDANVYTGLTTIAGGTLQIGNGGGTGVLPGDVQNDSILTFNRNNLYTYDGVIAGNGTVNQVGTGTTVLTADQTYTGATNVTGGTLLVNGDNTAATGLTSVSTGGALGGTGTVGGNVAVTDGFLAPGDDSEIPGTLTINGNLNLADASTLNYNFGQAGVVGGALNDLIEIGGDLTLDGTLAITTSAGGSFGVGVYRIMNYTGDLTNNTLDIDPSYPTPADLYVQTSVDNQVNLINKAGLTLNFWDGSGAKNDDVVSGGNGVWQNIISNDNWTDPDGDLNAPYSNGSFAVFTGTPGEVVVNTSSGAVETVGMQFVVDGYTITGDPLTLSGAQAIIRVGDGTAASAGYTTTISSELTGASQLVKTDLGTLVLTGANTYTGGTLIDNGTIAINNDNNLGDVAGSLTFDGGTLRTDAGITSDRALVLNTEGGTIDTNGFDSTLNGNITGDGDLTKDGTGVLTLLGDHTGTGLTTITDGTLQIGNGGTTGSITGDIANNSILTFNHSDELVYGGDMTGTGVLNKEGTGTLILTGTNEHTGLTTITDGTLQIGNGGTTGSLTGDILNNSALVFNRSDELTYDSAISGTGTVSQDGSGTTILTGDNSYEGDTTVNNGALYINGNQTAATGTTTVNDGGTLGGNGTIGGDVLVNTGATLAPGESSGSPSTLTINGDLSLQDGSSLAYNFGQAGTPGGALNDLVDVAGDLTLDGTIDITETPGGNFLVGVYRIMNYGGTLTNNDLTIGTAPVPVENLFLQTSIPNQINLINKGDLVLSFWDGGITDNKNNGGIEGGDGIWQGPGAPLNDNWTDENGTVTADYEDDTFAIFGGTSGTVQVDDSEGPVTSAGMQFTTSGYVIEGDDILLSETEPDSGQTVIRVGDGTAPSAGMVATINSALGGSVDLLKEDLGTLVLGGDNTYTGDTFVNAGTLLVEGSIASSLINIADGAELGVSNGSAINDSAAVVSSGTGVFTVNNDETIGSLAGNGTVDLNNGAVLTTGGNNASTLYEGVISGDGGLTKDGSGTMILTGEGSDFTSLNLLAGNLQIGGNYDALDPEATPQASSVTVDTFNQIMGATLTLDVLSPSTPLTVDGDAFIAGNLNILNVETLTKSVNKVLINVGGTVEGEFANLAHDQELFSNKDYKYVISYKMGNGNDIGVRAILTSGSTLNDAVAGMLRASQESSLGLLDDLEDRIMLHRRTGFYEDRKASTISTALNGDSAGGIAGTLKSEGFYASEGFSEFSLDGDDLSGRTNTSKVGYENRVNPDLWLGWQLANGRTNWSDNGVNGDLDSYRLSLYTSWTMQPRWFLDAALSGGLLDLETRRDGGQEGDANGMDVQAFARVVWRAIDKEQDNGFVRLAPYVGVRGVWTDLGTYNEDGGTPVSVSGQSSVLGQLYAGVDWSQWYDVGSGRGWGYHARIQGYVADTHQLKDGIDATSGTNMSSMNDDHWGVRMTLGADYCFGDWTLSGDASFTESQHSDTWQTKLSITRWW